MKRLLCAVGALLLLSGCGTTGGVGLIPKVQVQYVNVPVAVKCHPDIGAEPNYPDTDAKLKAAPDLFARVQALLVGRLMRIQRDAEKSAALKACEG